MEQIHPQDQATLLQSRTLLGKQYTDVRQQSLNLCRPLQAADYELQAAEFVSPIKWHLAHTSWFFETFLLKPNLAGYQEFHPQFGHLFNSYYNGIGQPYKRNQRGLLSRPSLEEVLAYRHYVDQAMLPLLSEPDLCPLIELGLNHEQQHQELMLTDLLYNWSFNPLYPTYQPQAAQVSPSSSVPPIQESGWTDFDGGIYRVGHNTHHGFAFDNEGPKHEVLIRDFSLAQRLTSNREYLGFIQDGGYRNPEFWLSDGWAWVQQQGIEAPLYWLLPQTEADSIYHFTLNGLQALKLDAPVTHISFYEADAFARWSGARLATEFEWEVSSYRTESLAGNFVENKQFQPLATDVQGEPGLQQQFGDCWEWTSSPYQPYPDYQPAAGAVGEYNGKFMCNQMVLRGGSCVTPADHIRNTYRNFFYPHERWQFTGIRLARS